MLLVVLQYKIRFKLKDINIFPIFGMICSQKPKYKGDVYFIIYNYAGDNAKNTDWLLL